MKREAVICLPFLTRGFMRKKGKREAPSPLRTKALLGAAVFFLALFCVSAFQVFRISSNLAREQQSFQELSKTVRISETANPQTGIPPAPVDASPSILPQYAALHQENPDLAGWVRIEDTKLDYPVMFTPEEPEYYLRRAFDKSDSLSGTPFIGEGSSVKSGNVLIYGHKMKNGTMFSALLDYAQESFWKDHPLIQFDSLYEESTYEVIGAFYSRAYYQNETGVFRYYQYPDFSNREQFEEYCQQVKASSLYDTGIEADYGDQLLTLSTCSYHVKEGRFVVVARKIN